MEFAKCGKLVAIRAYKDDEPKSIGSTEPESASKYFALDSAQEYITDVILRSSRSVWTDVAVLVSHAMLEADCADFQKDPYEFG